MRVLTVNPGSGSLRVHLVDPEIEQVLDGREIGHPPTETAAQDELAAFLTDADAPDAVAHRLVHGGSAVTAPVRVDDTIVESIERAESLAPQHVPATLALVRSLRQRLPDVPHLVCPDTAFHAQMPEHARTYPLPRRWRDDWALRRYGFHGLSLAWATWRACALLGRAPERTNLLIAHLSGGCSVTAVEGGRGVDTSMGLTPLAGVPMSRRSGNIDPGLLLWLLREDKLTPEELDDGLQHESGLLGLSDGLSGDTRELVRAADAGNGAARLALDVFHHLVCRELGAVATSVPRIDGLVFTGDIGWDQPEVAEAVASGLHLLGIRGGLDTRREQDAVISPTGAAIPVMAVVAREEIQLAVEATEALLGGAS